MNHYTQEEQEKWYDFANNCLRIGDPEGIYRAISVFSSLAEDGMARAQAKLAYIYSNPFYIEPDQERAFYWTKKAAAQNYPLSISGLAAHYWYGLCVEKDQKKAIELYLKAAELGDGYSYWALGKIYSGGEIEIDLDKAKIYFLKAIENGYTEDCPDWVKQDRNK